MGTSCLQALRILTLEPERLKNRSTTLRTRVIEDGKGSYPRRSSGLRVHFVDVEVFSLLPQCQRNGCNLACQRESYHGRLDAFGERALVELLKRSGLHAGPNGGGFKQAFEIMVVILVQAADGRLFFAPPHLPVDVVIFPAVAGFQPQSAVGPQLALTAKTMGSLNQGYRQSRANRSQGGNLSELGGDGMFATLRQQFAPRLLAQVLEHGPLLIELLGSPARPRFGNLLQPLAAMASVVNIAPGTGDRPAAIQRFQPIHD